MFNIVQYSIVFVKLQHYFELNWSIKHMNDIYFYLNAIEMNYRVLN